MNIKCKIISLILLLSVVIVPLGVYSADTNNSSQNNSSTTLINSQNLSHNNTTILKVSDLLEPATNASGPTALQEVLSYYGKDVGIDELVNLTNNSENGTLPTNIAQAATALGFTAKINENLSLETLQQNVDLGIPVIVNIQAGVNSTDTNWTNEQLNGQYMVVVGVDSQNVYLEDPTIIGSTGYIPIQEFLDRWHSTFLNGTNSTNNTVISNINSTNSTNSTNVTSNITYNHLGIIITGGTSTSRPLFLKIN